MATGLFAHYLVRGEFDSMTRLATELHALAVQSNDDAIMLAANTALGVARFTVGDLDSALVHLERVIAEYHPDRHGPMALSFGQDFGVVAQSYSAFALGVMGRPAQARTRSAEAVAAAERLAHPHTLALALGLRGALHQTLQEAAIVGEDASRLRDLAVEQGFGHWEVEAWQLLSWTAALEGRFDEAFRLTGACAAAARRIGATQPQVFHQPAIIEILLLSGRAADALSAADELLGFLKERRTRWFLEPEISRMRARALAALGTKEQAEAATALALDMASSRGAHLIALRCAADLLELRAPGTRQETLAVLVDELLERFEPAEAAPDVRRARELRGVMPVAQAS
jgi:hypothetical protein